MDKSKAREIVERNLPRLVEELGIRHWTIKVDYDLRDEDSTAWALGQCDRLLDYERATISLCPDGFDDEDQLLAILLHELLHVVLAPFDLVSSVADELTKGDDKLNATVARVWRHAMEQAVVGLERMYEALKRPQVAPSKGPQGREVTPCPNPPGSP